MIYVDDMFIPKRIGRLNAKWSHLFAFPFNENELHEFAQKLYLKRGWFQQHKLIPHYDVVELKRNMAIKKGAIPIPYKQGIGVILEHLRGHKTEKEVIEYLENNKIKSNFLFDNS